MSGLWLVSYVALWVLFLIVSLLMISILYHIGVIYNRLDNRRPPPTKLIVGEQLPDIRVKNLGGAWVQISELLSGSRGVAIVVVSPACSPCRKILKAIAAGESASDGIPNENTVIISMYDAVATTEMVNEVGLPATYPILVDVDNSVSNKWGVSATPVVIEVDGEKKLSRQTFFVN